MVVENFPRNTLFEPVLRIFGMSQQESEVQRLYLANILPGDDPIFDAHRENYGVVREHGMQEVVLGPRRGTATSHENARPR